MDRRPRGVVNRFLPRIYLVLFGIVFGGVNIDLRLLRHSFSQRPLNSKYLYIFDKCDADGDE